MKTPHSALAGKTALITGAAQRIGAAIALSLAKAGVHVALHYKTSENEATATADKARSLGVHAWTIQADISRLDEVDELMNDLRAMTGPVQFLVNNAAVFPASTLPSIQPEELLTTLTINALAPLRLTQLFAKQTDKGTVINMLDCRIERYDLNHAAYQLSKNLLYHITEMTAAQYAPGIRVNGIALGPILPPPGSNTDYLDRLSKTTLIGRAGEVEEVTDTVLFLLSNAYITGEIIAVDGGNSLKGGLFHEPGNNSI